MGVQTRSSAPSSPAKGKSAVVEASDQNSVAQMEAPKLFILPDNTSTEARFILLKDPRDGNKRRYYFTAQLGLYEITRVNAPSTDTRSVLIASSTSHSQEAEDCGRGECVPNQDFQYPNSTSRAEPVSSGQDITAGYVNKAAEVFIATPMDLIFILLALVWPSASNPKDGRGKRLFQPLEDLLDDALHGDKHLQYILDKSRPRIERGLESICDTVVAGDETMYRISERKALQAIIKKAQNLVEKGLPVSLEEKFVTRVLEAPILSVKREDTLSSAKGIVADVEIQENVMDVCDSQSSTTSILTLSTTSEVASTTTVTTIDEKAVPTNIAKLQRLRTAITFITSSYVPPHIVERFHDVLLSETPSVDFRPLDDHLKRLAALRADALTSRSLSDFSRKRVDMEDEEASELRAEKKRKQDEEDKRKKAGESRAVRDLKKVNVAGMKKMSDFFSKRPPAAKAKS